METEKKPRRPRRRFTDEFKAGAVRLVLEEGKAPSTVADDLDIHQSVIGRWVEQAQADRGKSARGTLATAEKEELTRLRKRVRELEIERSILKKAAAFFAKESA